MKRRASNTASGFTMIELMIVIGIMGIIAGIGIPQMFRNIQKEPTRQAISDIVEGCRHARAQAILKGTVMALIINAEDGSMRVAAAPASSYGTGGFGGAYSTAAAGNSSGGSFSARLHDDVALEMLMINLQDQMESDQAVIRFYPNGVSDELIAVILGLGHERHKISLEAVTGLPQVEQIN